MLSWLAVWTAPFFPYLPISSYWYIEQQNIPKLPCINTSSFKYLETLYIEETIWISNNGISNKSFWKDRSYFF